MEKKINVKGLILLGISLPIFVSCSNAFPTPDINDLKIQQEVDNINKNLPMRLSETIWKDSIRYFPKEKKIVHYFSLTVDEQGKEIIKQMSKNESYFKTFQAMENNSFSIENNLSLGIVYKSKDGELIVDKTFSPDELKRMASGKNTTRDMMESVYSLMADATNAAAPIKSDECLTVTGAEYSCDNRGIFVTFYWNIDVECSIDKTELKEFIRSYLVEVIRGTEKDIIKAANIEKVRCDQNDFPLVTLTVVCKGGSEYNIKESVLSTDVELPMQTIL